MARMNSASGIAIADLLEIRSDDRVLEIGFGSGTIVAHLLKRAAAGQVAGIDPSAEMVAQARGRNAGAVNGGRADLRLGSAETLPFDDAVFDKALSINSMQVWADAAAGLCEIHRVVKPGGRIALGFTRYSGQPREGVADMLTAVGFTHSRTVEQQAFFCVLAEKP